MKKRKLVALVCGTALVGLGSGFVHAQSKGPKATYWMTAETTSGFGAAMMGQNRASMMGALMSGRGLSNGYTHSLRLQLGSTGTAAAPSAEHLPPAGLNAGPSLPLVTPRSTPSEPWNGKWEKPKGQMLIYWGCGEHVGPGQPMVIDFAKVAAGQMPPGFSAVTVSGQTPPAPGKNATYAEWPNDRSKTTVPPSGSLVGDHVIRGNYSPEIKFSLAPGQDFMPPLQANNAQNGSGSIGLSWRAISTAKAYFAGLMGAKEDGTVVVWSSSAVRMPGMALPDYMNDTDMTRLIGQKVLLSPQTTQCTIPVEVARAAPNGMIQTIAYGPEANFSYPARPANVKAWTPDWTVKVRTKSTNMAILGMDMSEMGMGGDDGDDDTPSRQQEQQQPKKKKKGILGGIGGIPFP